MTSDRLLGVSVLATLMLFVAACGGDDSDNTQPAPDDGNNGNG